MDDFHEYDDDRLLEMFAAACAVEADWLEHASEYRDSDDELDLPMLVGIDQEGGLSTELVRFSALRDV